MNLLIPPAALLLGADILALAAGGAVIWLMGTDGWPLLLLLAAVVLAGVALALAWLAGGRRFVTMSALARIPLYVAWKLPLYMNIARTGAPKHWLRTERGEFK